MTEELDLCTCFWESPPPEPSPFEAVGEPRLYWTKGTTLNVHFLNGTTRQKERAAEIASEWTRHANLKFRFHFDPANPPRRYASIRIFGARRQIPIGLATDIAVKFWDNGGGVSHIGTNSRVISRSGQASMSIPKSLDKGVILHEFGHALGLHHEHRNPAANIQWNKPAVYQYYRDNFDWSTADVDHNVLTPLDRSITNFTEVDPTSIMMYHIPPGLTTNGFSTNWNSELSPVDIAFIAGAYPR